MSRLTRSLMRRGLWLSANICCLRKFATPRDSRSILIVRTDGIGDFVLWLTYAAAVRRRYPSSDYHLTLVAPQELHDLLQALGTFDCIIPFDRESLRNSFSYFVSLQKQISEVRASVAINPQVSRHRDNDLLTRASGANVTIGFDGGADPRTQSPNNLRRYSKWYSKLIASPEKSHDLEANIQFARFFDAEFPNAYPALPANIFTFPRWLPQTDYFVIQPQAGSPEKQWPAESFLAIANRLIAKTGWTPVVCGSLSDRSACSQFSSLIEGPVINTCGEITLRDLCGVLSQAKLAISNDTGPAHVAAAVGCPVIVPFGGWHFGRFFPYPKMASLAPHCAYPVFRELECFGCSWTCRFGREPQDAFYCLKTVSVDDVWNQLVELLPSCSSRKTFDTPRTSQEIGERT
ncbi:MAG: glycosyltransferase family 9 protein [Afipia felis]|nr:glycosyltransferase family 9 protein [Afipia felis]